MLPRARLVDDFGQNDVRVTILCADAGYGKTTLMGQFYQDLDGKLGVWYQLGLGDKNMAVFLAHLVEGVSSHMTGFGAAMDRALSGMKNTDGDWESYLTVFINEISASDKPFVFFFDEFQLANDFENIRDAVQFLIKYLPTDYRVVLASRERTSLSLGRLRTQRKLKEIDTEDLRFTMEEMEGVYRGCCEKDLNEDELRIWYTATQGWPVAIVLSRNLLTIERRIPEHVNPELLGEHGTIAGYLAEEVWSELDDELKQFLMVTSILDTVDIEICDQALMAGEGKSSVGLLREMEARNLMISCLEEGRSYIYQPLVRQFLSMKLEQIMPVAEVDDLHRRYGEAYDGNGQYDLAIQHYLQSRSPDLAVGIIETRGEAILDAGHYKTLAKWLSQIPVKTITARPWLAYYSAKSSERLGDLAGAERWYEVAEKGFSSRSDAAGSYACAMSMAEFFFMRDMHRRSLEKAIDARKWAVTPEHKVAAFSRMATQNLLLGYGQEALELLKQAAALCDGTMVDTRFVLEVTELVPLWFAGEFPALHDEVIRLQRASSPRSLMFARFQILCWKVLALYEMARYEAALAAIDERSGYLGDEDQLFRLGFEFLRGVVLLNVGDGQAGREIIEGIDREVGDSKVLGPFYTPNYLGAYLRRQDELERAIEVHSSCLHHRDGGNQYTAASCLVNLGAARIRGRQHSEGIRNLEEARALAADHGYRFISTQACFNFAWAALEKGDNDKALAEIRKALKNASLYQHNNFIIEEGKISAGLIAFAFGHGIEQEYLLSVLPSIGPVAIEALAELLKSDSASVRTVAITALSASGGVAAAPYIRRVLRDEDLDVRRTASSELRRLRMSIDSPEKILTRRENQVMELIAEGMSNAEISERLYISEPTAKTHISRIFRKLGLTSRSQVAALFQKNSQGADVNSQDIARP